MKINNILYLIPILFSISGCNSNDEVSDLKIEAEKAIWINYDDNGTSFYDFTIDTNGNYDNIQFEYSEENYIEVSHLKENVYRVTQLKKENKTITLKAKLGHIEDSIRVHLVYKLEDVTNIKVGYIWRVFAPGYTYDMMWRTEKNDCGFAIELYPMDGLEFFDVVEQNKIKTIKDGRFCFIAKIGEFEKVYNMAILHYVPYNPKPDKPYEYDPDHDINYPIGDEIGDL